MKVEVVKNWWGARDAFGVPIEVQKRYGKADIDTHYVWIRNKEDRIMVKEGLGYTTCRASVSKKEKGEEGSAQVGSAIRYADLILMCIPQKDWENREKQKEELLKKRVAKKSKEELSGDAKKLDSRLSIVGKIENS